MSVHEQQVLSPEEVLVTFRLKAAKEELEGSVSGQCDLPVDQTDISTKQGRDVARKLSCSNRTRGKVFIAVEVVATVVGIATLCIPWGVAKGYDLKLTGLSPAFYGSESYSSAVETCTDFPQEFTFALCAQSAPLSPSQSIDNSEACTALLAFSVACTTAVLLCSFSVVVSGLLVVGVSISVIEDEFKVLYCRLVAIRAVTWACGLTGVLSSLCWLQVNVGGVGAGAGLHLACSVLVLFVFNCILMRRKLESTEQCNETFGRNELEAGKRVDAVVPPTLAQRCTKAVTFRWLLFSLQSLALACCAVALCVSDWCRSGSLTAGLTTATLDYGGSRYVVPLADMKDWCAGKTLPFACGKVLVYGAVVGLTHTLCTFGAVCSGLSTVLGVAFPAEAWSLRSALLPGPLLWVSGVSVGLGGFFTVKTGTPGLEMTTGFVLALICTVLLVSNGVLSWCLWRTTGASVHRSDV